MIVADPGHMFVLDALSDTGGVLPRHTHGSMLVFVKRIGAKYPGNEPPGYPGTTTQEVLRALISRMVYVQNQENDYRNVRAVDDLRHALFEMEHRAAERRGGFVELAILESAVDTACSVDTLDGIEDMPTCRVCGHIACSKHTQGDE